MTKVVLFSFTHTPPLCMASLPVLRCEMKIVVAKRNWANNPEIPVGTTKL